MADTVRNLLEEMVPELEDLERRGYFTRDEVRSIVARRQDFEYALRRKAALKDDFLRYIEYESSLERLRRLRRRTRGARGRASLADHCIVRRIHFIYERATRKFRGDLSLWAAWLAHCGRTRSRRVASRVLTAALRLHPTQPALWTAAARWELEAAGDAGAARALMQRGLRLCPAAPALWREYFRMELLYAARLAARRQVLGLQPDGGAGAGDAGGAAEPGGLDAVLRGAVARVVYDTAVARVPGPLAFRAGLLGVLDAVGLEGADELRAHIVADIEAAFGGEPAGVALLARERVAAAAGGGADEREAALRAALARFDAALEAAAGKPGRAAELRAELLGFLEERLREAFAAPPPGDGGGGDDSLRRVAGALALAKKCLQVAADALREREQGGAVDDALLLAGVRAQLRLGAAAEARTAAEAAIAAAPGSLACWRQLLALAAADDAASGEAAAARAVAPGAARAHPAAWLAALRGVAAAGGDPAPLLRELTAHLTALPRGPPAGGFGAVAAAGVRAAAAAGGAAAARDFYRPLLRLPPPGGDFFHAVLDLEAAAAEGGAGGALPRPRRAELFEAGVAAYGEDDAALWLKYLRFAEAGGTGAGQVHWRAVKALRSPDAFIEEAQRRGSLA